MRNALAVPTGAQGSSTDGWFGPNFSTTVIAVPEPTSLSLAALGLIGLAGFGPRHRRAGRHARARVDMYATRDPEL